MSLLCYLLPTNIFKKTSQILKTLKSYLLPVLVFGIWLRIQLLLVKKIKQGAILKKLNGYQNKVKATHILSFFLHVII